MSEVRFAKRPNILCLGDSITEFAFNPERHGYVAFLANHYSDRFDVINRGFGGYSTKFICDLLPYLYPSNYPKEDAPKLVIIFLGVNDSCYEEIWPLQHVPVETYGKNLESVYSIYNHMKNINNDTKFIFVTPSKISEKRWKMECTRIGRELDRSNENIVKYAEKCIEISKKLNVPYIDLYHPVKDEDPENEDYTIDGLHFHYKMYDLLNEKLIEVIEKNYPELKMENVKLHAPDAYTVNYKNPKETFEKHFNYKA